MGELETLNGAARAVDEARRAAASVFMQLRRAQKAEAVAENNPGDGTPGMKAIVRLATAEALTCADQATSATNTAYTLLLSLGAERPGKAIPRDKVPLELLDTPATRELLAALDAVVVAARRVDRERGWVDDDGVGIGFEETFAAHRLQLQRDVCGATNPHE